MCAPVLVPGAPHGFGTAEPAVSVVEGIVGSVTLDGVIVSLMLSSRGAATSVYILLSALKPPGIPSILERARS